MKALIRRWVNRLVEAYDEAELARFRARLKPGDLVEFRRETRDSMVIEQAIITEARTLAVNGVIGGTRYELKIPGSIAYTQAEAWRIFPVGWSETHKVLPCHPSVRAAVAGEVERGGISE